VYFDDVTCGVGVRARVTCLRDWKCLFNIKWERSEVGRKRWCLLYFVIMTNLRKDMWLWEGLIIFNASL
jgi:hypothetical protein